MSVSLDLRIKWLHKQIFDKRYPNAFRISEKFGISHRQAQRDIDYLKNEMKAPLVYDAHKKGFTYEKPFSLPSYSESANEEDYSGVVSRIKYDSPKNDVGESETLQMQIPYSAKIKISSKLGILELKDFIVSGEARDTYICEFHNIDLFLGMLFTLDADIEILSPDWLREKLTKCAERVLKNNKND